PLVALGPREVRVTPAQGTPQKMALIRLTPEADLLAQDNRSTLTKVAAADQQFVKIETTDGKQTWQLDTAKKVYVGPKLGPAEAPAPPVAQPVTPEQEDLYL